ncbi:plakophilin-1 [Denticeps clupeoides]|uniref:Plakophilin 1 n=1 Tax=Denticeps clupeoides TaxID=299321 RepID=A0AAY4EWC6_9TELE|nr:plakophilin-1-like [Denticeps clupeoides]
MTLEPFRSATSIGPVVETSLALPSDAGARSAQQRVLEQVSTVKRTKSRSGSRSGSGLGSPTSPQSDSVFYDYQFVKSTPATPNGYGYFKAGSTSNGHSKMAVQQELTRQRSYNSKGTMSQRSIGSTSMRNVFPYSPAAFQTKEVGYGTCRSVPDLSPLLSTSQPSSQVLRSQSSKYIQWPVERNGYISSNGTSQTVVDGSVQKTWNNQSFAKRPPSSHSNTDLKVSVAKTKIEPMGQATDGQKTDMTVKEAIELLSSSDESRKLYGVSVIQHSTYTDEKTKQEVSQLKGIPPLVALLASNNAKIQDAVSAALRNLVYKSQNNKEEVQRCGGVTQAVQLLRDTDSVDTQKHLTGLLWNLSSADSLKSDLVRGALPFFTESVIIPYASPSDSSANCTVDPEVFYNSTACLRNLSSSKVVNRQAMRNTRGLIDALVRYMQTCVEEDRPDDKSAENCVCILHNLTYQLETEAPTLFSKINALAGSSAKSTGTTGPIGCFSPQSNKVQQTNFDYLVKEDRNPKGAQWLFHSKTLQTYLALLKESSNEAMLEACCGAMQNLTVKPGPVSTVISQTIIQKLSGLKLISDQVKSTMPNLQRSAVALLGNLSKTPQLQSTMAREALPELTRFISAGMPNVGKELSENDESMATACHAAHTLLMAEHDVGKKLVNNTFVNSLNDMSHNGSFPMASKAAAVLLYSLWSEKDFQSVLKKNGMNKSFFVNEITTAAHKSSLVID